MIGPVFNTASLSVEYLESTLESTSTPLPFLSFDLQTRRRLFRRRHSGKRYGHGIRNPARLHSLADRDWNEL